MFFELTSYLTSIFAIILGGYVLIRNPKNVINQSFALLALASVIWSTGLSLEVTALNQASGLFWAKILHIGVVFLHSSYYHFVVSILGLNKQKKRTVFILYLSSFIFLLLIPTNLFIKGVMPIMSFNYYTQAGLLYPVFLMFFFWGVFYGCYLLIKFYKKLGGHRKKQVFYFSIATLIGFTGGSTTYLPVFGISFYPVANYFVFIYLLLTAIAVTKHELMDIKVVIKNTTAIFIVSCFVIPIFGFSVYFLGHNSFFLICWMIFLGLISVLFGKDIQEYLITGIKHKFIRGYYDADKLLVQITELAGNTDNCSQIFEIIDEKLYNELELEKSLVIFAQRKNDDVKMSLQDVSVSYLLREIDYEIDVTTKVMNKNVLQEKAIQIDHPLINYFHNITVTSLFKYLDSEIKKEIINLGFNKKACVLPFHSPEILEGLVIIGERSNQAVYKKEDLNFFKMLINNINAVFYKLTPYEKIEQEFQKNKEKLYQTQLQLLRSEKNASLARVTLNTNHELRSPLFTINMANYNLKKKQNISNSDIQDFMHLIDIQTSRALKVIDNSIELGSVTEKKQEPLNFNDLIKEVIELKPPSGFSLETNLTNIPLISGNKTDLISLLLNLLNNAINALPQINGKIIINTFFDSNTKNIVLKISDNGKGISPENLEKIWEPYFTTNTTDGHGLGLSIVNQIVLNHKANIKVETNLNMGTSFIISFPQLV